MLVKLNLYANRITADNPTRLFVDATNEKKMERKGFFNDWFFKRIQMNLVMMRYLFPKRFKSFKFRWISPETDELTCSKIKMN